MQKKQDANATAKDVRLAPVYIEKQWKSSAMERKNAFCVNGF